ncbi:MAG: glycosyl transferase, family 9 [Parcubacteria group bacterium Gr01-1014_17]|nr:MAG: glycosyl transferase, family 9 [Parcubacteria group bacterium Gr01-1014_17]
MIHSLFKRFRLHFFALAALALFPLLAILARIRARGRTGNAPRILVVPILTRVGDLVCSTPVFREIKMHFPNAHLAVVVGRKAKGILVHNPRIDDLIDYNNERFHGFAGRWRFFYFLYSQKFDAVFSLGTSVIGTLSCIFAAAPIRVKTVVAHPPFFERLTDWMNTDRVTYTHGTFLQKHYVSLLSALGVRSAQPIKEVFTTEAGERKARAFFDGAFGGVPPLLVGMTVSAGNKIKEWPLARFAEVADILVEKYGARIIFIDSPANRERTEEVVGLMKRRAAACAIDFSLEELPSLIKRLHAFVAVDTGAIYIAHALGVPLVDIIGPVEPNEQPPSDEKSVQVLPASGIEPTSFVFYSNECNGNYMPAVLSITAPQVVAAFELLIARGFVRNAQPFYEKNS